MAPDPLLPASVRRRCRCCLPTSPGCWSCFRHRDDQPGLGDRGGPVRDPLGNIWWIQTHVEHVDQEEIAKRAAEQPFRDALQYTQESLDREMRSRGRE